MKGSLIIAYFLFLSASALASPEKKDLNESVSTRLSWGPYEYLKQGFRNAPWVNDPFYPEARILRVSGMVSDEMAYINNQWYRLGDVVQGYTVKSIKPEGVSLVRQNELLLLKVKD